MCCFLFRSDARLGNDSQVLDIWPSKPVVGELGLMAHVSHFDYCGLLYFRGYQFSWIEENKTFVEFKIRGHSTFLNNSYRNLFRLALKFVDGTLHENHENWYPTKMKPSTVYCN